MKKFYWPPKEEQELVNYKCKTVEELKKENCVVIEAKDTIRQKVNNNYQQEGKGER